MRLPVSFYLLIAMVVVLVLGAQMVLVREDPKRFAFYLTLMFIFFFVVMFRAVVDVVEITKKHFRERENLFHDTLGDADFVSELGKGCPHPFGACGRLLGRWCVAGGARR